ncbi:MAG: TIGR02757 family protein [Deltaproteobacteria bacterium]|nr:TIGR02757 family protein [Deltaproteobacteria bacterium]
MPANREKLETLFSRYQNRQWVHPDPLEFLYLYNEERDREIVGLIASSLAYGRVAQILKSVSVVLEQMGTSPRDFLLSSTDAMLQETFAGFKHRFTAAEDLIDLLRGVRDVCRRFGSLHNCFMKGHGDQQETVYEPLCFLVNELLKSGKNTANTLLPLPERGSACKRLHLFLRWVVRNDAVDPGGWHGVSPSKLIVPLDTHMHRIGARLGMTERRQGNLKTAMEITDAFRRFAPEDPVKYDFVLTRLGIRNDCDPGDLF